MIPLFILLILFLYHAYIEKMLQIIVSTRVVHPSQPCPPCASVCLVMLQRATTGTGTLLLLPLPTYLPGIGSRILPCHHGRLRALRRSYYSV